MSEETPLSRREFLAVVGVLGAIAAMPRAAWAQQEPNTGAANVPMDENRYRPVRLPAKRTPVLLTDAQRDLLEHQIHCQCGCNLDVYTCRTTDFSCPVSPAMHKDVMALVAGGYSGREILDAFVSVYGPRVLMAPKKQGFDLAGWVMPFVALGAGTALVVTLLRRWARRAPPEAPPLATAPPTATPEELAQLESLLRRDDT